jgi:hypothetical protein
MGTTYLDNDLEGFEESKLTCQRDSTGFIWFFRAKFLNLRVIFLSKISDARLEIFLPPAFS